MNSTSPKAAAQVAMTLLDTLQNKDPGTQTAGAAVIFLTLCRRYNIRPQEAITCADNIMKQARRYDDATFKGIADYYKNEL